MIFGELTSDDDIFFSLAPRKLKLHQEKDLGELSRFLQFQSLTRPLQTTAKRHARRRRRNCFETVFLRFFKDCHVFLLSALHWSGIETESRIMKNMKHKK